MAKITLVRLLSPDKGIEERMGVCDGDGVWMVCAVSKDGVGLLRALAPDGTQIKDDGSQAGQIYSAVTVQTKMRQGRLRAMDNNRSLDGYGFLVNWDKLGSMTVKEFTKLMRLRGWMLTCPVSRQKYAHFGELSMHIPRGKEV